jgi:hypothetical protein
VAEVLAGDLLAFLLAPLGKAQPQVRVHDAPALARNLVEQPSDAVTEASDEAVRQDSQKLEQADGALRAESVQHARAFEAFGGDRKDKAPAGAMARTKHERGAQCAE